MDGYPTQPEKSALKGALLEGARRVIEDTGGNQARGTFG